ncbi:hypothetical protein Q7P35_006700 [Cladosporium inversicolor]
MNTTIHVDTGQEPSPTKQQQPKRQLKREKGRIFGNGVLKTLRKISGNKNPSSFDPEDAPKRPHIVPPLHDSSDPELGKRSKAIGATVGNLVDPGYALTPQEKLSEITELMRVRQDGH